MALRRSVALRPRLLRTAATTAVVAAVGGAIRHRRANKHAEQLPSRPVEPGAVTDDQLNRLERLAELRKAGVLTQEEFEVQKVAILGTRAAAEEGIVTSPLSG